MDLPQVRGERRQRVALGRIACVSIEHLLDVLQVGDDFLRDLRAHLQQADALAEIGAQSRRRLARGSTLRRVEQPAAHDDDLLLEIRRWGGEVVDHAFHQQERRSHLDHHELLLARMRIGQLGGDERDGVEQLHQMLVAALAPYADVLSIKALSSSGAGTTVSVLQAIQIAATNKAEIIVLPLSGLGDSEAFKQAIARTSRDGILLVAAAGNSGPH